MIIDAVKKNHCDSLSSFLTPFNLHKNIIQHILSRQVHVQVCLAIVKYSGFSKMVLVISKCSQKTEICNIGYRLGGNL